MEEEPRAKPAVSSLPAPKIMLPRAGIPLVPVVHQVSSVPITRPIQTVQGKAKAHVSILPELCKGCDLCVLACPSGNLALSSQLNRSGYHPAVFSYEGTKGPCSACGLCYWVCPDFAISEIRTFKQ